MIDWSMVVSSAIGEYIALLAGAATLSFFSKKFIRDIVVLIVETCVKTTKKDYKERLQKYVKDAEK
jgi:hypothetical protein